MNLSENIYRSDFYYDNTQGALGGNTRLHYHQNYELYFLEKGNCGYYVDDRYYALRPGDLIFIKNTCVHRTNYDKNPHSRRLINFGEEYVPSEFLSELGETYIFRNPNTIKEIQDIFELIQYEYNSRDEYSDRMIKSHMCRLFCLVLRHKEENICAFSGNKIVEKVVEYVKKNYAREISLSNAAEKNAVSSEHLSRIFKREMGVGFNEYLNSLRLRQAEFMLRNEDGKSVSEVAFACGFNDSNYFSYRFKKAYGVSPINLKNKK